MSRPIQSCGATGHCERCVGRGSHYRETFEAAECEVCDGSGECPCIFEGEAAHANPAEEVMDHHTYLDQRLARELQG